MYAEDYKGTDNFYPDAEFNIISIYLNILFVYICELK